MSDLFILVYYYVFITTVSFAIYIEVYETENYDYNYKTILYIRTSIHSVVVYNAISSDIYVSIVNYKGKRQSFFETGIFNRKNNIFLSKINLR